MATAHAKTYLLAVASFPLIMILVLLLAPSCTHEPSGIEEMDTICFESQVMPILQTSCGMTGCHGSGSAQEGFDVSSYSTIMEAVTPGDPRASNLYKVITNINGEVFMPPDIPLTLEQRTIIQLWILQGATNTCGNDSIPGGGGIVYYDSICFAQNILPLFISNCAMASCHDGLSQGEEENLFPLNSYATIIPHVQPYSPSGSPVYRAVNGQEEEFMPPPPKSPLTAAQKELMKKWISEGALNSDCPNANCDTTGTISFSSGVKPIIDNYCISCHNATTTNGSVNLNGYAQVKTYAETIRNGVPILVGVTRQQAGFKAMPPFTQLDPCAIRTIELWIDQGRLNN
jgi:hypothetical protein